MPIHSPRAAKSFRELLQNRGLSGGRGELGFELLVEAHKLLDGVGHDEGNKNVPYNLVFLTTHLYLVRDLILLHVSHPIAPFVLRNNRKNMRFITLFK